MRIEELLQSARERGASDLILVAGRPPCVHIHGQWLNVGDEPLDARTLHELLLGFMTPEQKSMLAEGGDADFAHGAPQLGRVRVNVHRQRGSLAAAFRFVAERIPDFDELRLPAKLAELARLPRGLVLVTGATGSGKSTTLAAMIGYMNRNLARHIITLEDPVEFVFSHEQCVIEQREIGDDSPSFAAALRHVVRQKPDVILVGEMRDRETIATALTAAETGHLVLGTLHTNSAAQTIDRVVDSFEAAQQRQVQSQLASTLQAVICQALVPRADGAGMVPALELMFMTPAIRRAIRDHETHLIPSMIETGGKFGMCSLDTALADLVRGGIIDAKDALARAGDYERLEKSLGALRSTSDRGSIPQQNLRTLATTGTKSWQ